MLIDIDARGNKLSKYLRSIFISIQDQYLEKQKSYRTLATSAENWKKTENSEYKSVWEH